MTDLTDTDALAIARTYLNDHPMVVEVLGGAGRVAALNEPPYPRIVLTDPPGNDLALRGLLAPLIQVEALGDPSGDTPKPVLRKVLYRVLQVLRELPEQEYLTGPVITAVTSTGGGGWSPLPTGQPRYLATVQVWVHPPRD